MSTACDDRAGRAAGGGERAGREEGVAVDRGEARVRRARRERREVGGRVRAQDFGVARQRRLDPHEVGERLGLERGTIACSRSTRSGGPAGSRAPGSRHG